MLMGLIAGLLTGFFLAIPPGPINIAIFEKSVHGQHRAAHRLIAGGVTGDTFYCLMAIIYQLSSELLSVLNLVFSALGGIFLTGLGAYYILLKKTPVPSTAALDVDHAHHGHYLTGVLISLSNPFFILVMVAVTELYYSLGVLFPEMGNNLVFIFGFQGGAFLWLWAMGRVASRHRHYFAGFSKNILNYCGWSFLLFGLYMLAKCAKLIWLGQW